MGLFDSEISGSESLEPFLESIGKSDDPKHMKNKRDGLVVFGSKKTVEHYMTNLDFFYRFDKVETFVSPHNFLSLCYKIKSMEGLEFNVPVGGFYEEEDLEELSTVAKSFVVLIDKEENEAEKVLKTASTYLLPFIQDIKPQIVVSFGLINFTHEDKFIKAMTKDFRSPIIELSGFDDISTIIEPSVNRSSKIH